MNSSIFTINKEQLKKAGIKFILVLLGAVATFLEMDLFKNVELQGAFLMLAVAVNTAIVDMIRKFISDEEGKLGGII
jgi:hypothetical protein